MQTGPLVSPLWPTARLHPYTHVASHARLGGAFTMAAVTLTPSPRPVAWSPTAYLPPACRSQGDVQRHWHDGDSSVVRGACVCACVPPGFLHPSSPRGCSCPRHPHHPASAALAPPSFTHCVPAPPCPTPHRPAPAGDGSGWAAGARRHGQRGGAQRPCHGQHAVIGRRRKQLHRCAGRGGGRRPGAPPRQVRPGQVAGGGGGVLAKHWMLHTAAAWRFISNSSIAVQM